MPLRSRRALILGSIIVCLCASASIRAVWTGTAPSICLSAMVHTDIIKHTGKAEQYTLTENQSKPL